MYKVQTFENRKQFLNTKQPLNQSKHLPSNGSCWIPGGSWRIWAAAPSRCISSHVSSRPVVPRNLCKNSEAYGSIKNNHLDHSFTDKHNNQSHSHTKTNTGTKIWTEPNQTEPESLHSIEAYRVRCREADWREELWSKIGM